MWVDLKVKQSHKQEFAQAYNKVLIAPLLGYPELKFFLLDKRFERFWDTNQSFKGLSIHNPSIKISSFLRSSFYDLVKSW